MTYTEKRLEEMRKHREYQLWKESPDVKYLERREIYPAEFAEAFLTTSIAQAEQEMFKRVEEKHPKHLGESGGICVYCAAKDLLSSLDNPLTVK